MSVRSGDSHTLVVSLDYEPDEAKWQLEDETGALLLAEAAVASADIDGVQLTFNITGDDNTLAVDQYRGLRLVRIRYRSSDNFAGWREVEAFYDVLADTGELVVQVNSFVTYNEALLLAREVTETEAFDGATRELRVASLAEAWRALVRLRYDIPEDYDRVMSRVSDFPGADPGDLSDMTADEFLGLDAQFVAAIKRAQVVEAVERIAGRSGNDQRSKGLLSSTIGEVSQMYRSGRPLEYGISARALRELRGFITYTARIARA